MELIEIDLDNVYMRTPRGKPWKKRDLQENFQKIAELMEAS